MALGLECGRDYGPGKAKKMRELFRCFLSWDIKKYSVVCPFVPFSVLAGSLEAEIITNTILGAPYYNKKYSVPQNPLLITKAPDIIEPLSDPLVVLRVTLYRSPY